jgi:hypothetical protein
MTIRVLEVAVVVSLAGRRRADRSGRGPVHAPASCPGCGASLGLKLDEVLPQVARLRKPAARRDRQGAGEPHRGPAPGPVSPAVPVRSWPPGGGVPMLSPTRGPRRGGRGAQRLCGRKRQPSRCRQGHPGLRALCRPRTARARRG